MHKKNWLFENISNIEKPLARQRKKVDKIQILIIINGRVVITTDPADTKRITKNIVINFMQISLTK